MLSMLRLCKSSISNISIITRPFSFNTKLARRILVPSFPLKTLPGESIQICIAKHSDLSELSNFFSNNFIQDEPLVRSLSITHEDLKEEINEIVFKSVSCNLALIALHRGEIVAAQLSEKYEIKRLNEDVKTTGDYGNEIDKIQKSLKCSKNKAQLLAILERFDTIMDHTLPELSNSQYQLKLHIEKAKLGVEMGMTHCIGVYTAASSSKVGKKLNFVDVQQTNLKDVYDHGNLIFLNGKLVDGNDVMRLSYAKLENLANFN